MPRRAEQITMCARSILTFVGGSLANPVDRFAQGLEGAHVIATGESCHHVEDKPLGSGEADDGAFADEGAVRAGFVPHEVCALAVGLVGQGQVSDHVDLATRDADQRGGLREQPPHGVGVESADAPNQDVVGGLFNIEGGVVVALGGFRHVELPSQKSKARTVSDRQR